jgi:hypothetical protein
MDNGNMNVHEVFSQPFTQVTLPSLIGFFIATISQNKRFDDLGKRIDDLRGDMNGKFAGIDRKLESVERRLEMIQGRISGLVLRLANLES